MKRVLIIGNGFDLAHGLKTRYEDFLDFVSAIKPALRQSYFPRGKDYQDFLFSNVTDRISTKSIKLINDYVSDKIAGHSEDWMNVLENANEVMERLFDCIVASNIIERKDDDGNDLETVEEISNAWIEYFIYKRENGSIRGWAGFEAEIKSVIMKMSSGSTWIDEFFKFKANESREHNLQFLKYIDDEGKIDDYKRTFSNRMDKRKLLIQLEKDLRNLIRALSIYLYYFVGLQYEGTSRVDTIERIKPDYVVNFNYTNTYSKVYGNDARCLFVHGRADGLEENMVLGIDEFLPYEEKEKQIEYLEYRKYYQRIVKDTDTIGKMEKSINTNKYDTIFFGHSMSEIDREILLRLLPKSGSDNIEDHVNKAYICYNDDDSKKAMVLEMVRMLGAEEIQELTQGNDARLRFVSTNSIINVINSD